MFLFEVVGEVIDFTYFDDLTPWLVPHWRYVPRSRLKQHLPLLLSRHVPHRRGWPTALPPSWCSPCCTSPWALQVRNPRGMMSSHMCHRLVLPGTQVRGHQVCVVAHTFFHMCSHTCSLIRTMCVSTSFCLWIFWLCTYMSQLNPLVGPELLAANVYLE